MVSGKVLSSELAEALPLKIAAAEDNKTNQRVLECMLQRLGWTADFVENGSELIELINGKAYDLIFMDLQMPVMDGFEATCAIRDGVAGEVAKKAKIVAITANALEGHEAHCLRLGMDAFLRKPIRIQTLEQTIRQIFEVDEA